MNPSTRQKWKDFCDDHGFKLTEVPFHEPLHVLFERNFHRGKDAVPLLVIRDIYQKMREYMGEDITFNRELPKAIIYDLDGTLALNDHRSPYDLEKLSDDALTRWLFSISGLCKLKVIRSSLVLVVKVVLKTSL